MCIICEIKMWLYSRANNFVTTNYLFAAVQLIKNTNPDKCSFFGYDIGFGVGSSFSFSVDIGFGKNVIISGVENSSSAQVNNKKWIP